MLEKSLSLVREKRVQLVLILLTSLGFTASLLAVRMFKAGNMSYLFLIWNLFLAAIPFLISTYLLKAQNLKTPKTVLWLGLWLIFFPNAPYIITDLFHLRHLTGIPLWLDTALLVSAAWNGLILGLISLMDVQALIAKKLTTFLSWLFSLSVISLSGIGIYVGRYLRWNSWDLFVNPQSILVDMLEVSQKLHFWGMSLTYGTLLTLSYLIFYVISREKV